MSKSPILAKGAHFRFLRGADGEVIFEARDYRGGDKEWKRCLSIPDCAMLELRRVTRRCVASLHVERARP